MNSITLVTGLWDIGRGDLQEGWSRSFQHYLDKFAQLLKVDVNMIIFVDDELVWISSYKASSNYLVNPLGRYILKVEVFGIE